MFKSLVKTMFPSFVNEDFTPDYVSFERGRKIDEVEKEMENVLAASTKSKQQTQYDTVMIDPFYDYLFGNSEASKSNQQDQLSTYVAKKLNQLIQDPINLLKELPVMPTSVSKVMSLMGSPDFELEELLKVIEREPSMAADLIKLANSSRYKRGEKQVTDLHTAFMYMGAEGLKTGVIDVYLKRFSASSNLYFKQFGKKIWAHCFNTAKFAQRLAEKSLSKETAPTMYLVGLIKNLGDMVIFQLMIEAFKYVDPDATPSSQHFKQLMMEHSKKLTVQIVKYWQLPQSVVDVLMKQLESTQNTSVSSGLNSMDIQKFTDENDQQVKCIFEANILSQNYLMLQADQMNIQQFLQIQRDHDFSNAAKTLATKLIEQKQSGR